MAPLPTTIDRPNVISANDALVDLYMHRAVDLLRLEAGTQGKVVALLDGLRGDIAALIAKIDPTGTARTAIQRARLVKLRDQVEASIQATYRPIDVLMAKEFREVADIESTWTANAINSATYAEFADAGISRNQLSTLTSDVLIQGAPSSEWWGRQAAGLSDRFADEMRRGVALGENNSDLIDRTTSLMDISRTSAERLVRSSIQTAANVGRQATYEANSDLIKAEQWSATLDLKTSDWCMVRDGLQYTPIDHEPIDHDVPWLDGPGLLHWNCRSTSIPILKSWEDLGIDESEVPDTTRASMDGQVAADTTFEDWLSKQSEARQNAAMGEGKAQLWREGKISFRDLLDQGGRPVTTEELRANL